MIYLRILGGLGNQMFQFAAGLSLAIKKKTELGICLDILENEEVNEAYTYRKFELQTVFNLAPFKKIEPKKMDFYLNKNLSFLERIRRKFTAHSVFIEKSLNYSSEIHGLHKEAVIEGYFQSEKNFLRSIDEVLKTFEFKLENLNKKSKELSESFPKNALAIHVRRGDYVQNETINSVHGSCSIDYYKEGVNTFSNCEISTIFVFSDDPNWVKENLKFKSESVVIDWNQGSDSWQDMFLMSCCKYFVIANSSFSWWGAYLSQVEGKQVVAPSKWFADENKNKQTKDLIPTSWIKI